MQSSYNLINLPAQIKSGSTVKANYSYLSDGTKTKALNASSVGYDYAGSFTYSHASNGSKTLESVAFGGGRIRRTGNNAYAVDYHITDHLGSVRAIVNASGTVVEQNDYYPFGMRHPNGLTQLAANRWRFSGKEEQDAAFGIAYSDFGARLYDRSAAWTAVDPLAEKYYSVSPYVYCNNSPVILIDLNGEAWTPKYDSLFDGVLMGYSWVDEKDSYDDNGNLRNGLYHQAIFFSDNGTFDDKSTHNIGSSSAYVYLEDGSIMVFNASTRPSNSSRYPTIPEGVYEASVGKHQGKYYALKMYDVGKNLGNNTIELGFENPAFSDGRTYAAGINIHKAGKNNLTGMTRNGSPVSAGCMLIDINQWDDFINSFLDPEQINNTISVTVSRTMKAPNKPLNWNYRMTK